MYLVVLYKETNGIVRFKETILTRDELDLIPISEILSYEKIYQSN